jgi:hypothetical protein
MSDTVSLISLFDESTETATAIDELHALGIPEDKITIMSGVPYPEQALGRQREWLTLPYIVLAGAIGGLLFGLFLAVITPHLYRLDVGGHPPASFPPAAIIIFVFTMMATIVSTFLGVLWEMNFPRFGTAPYHSLVTHGYLAMLVEFPTALEDKVRQVLEDSHAHHIGEPERLAL